MNLERMSCGFQVNTVSEKGHIEGLGAHFNNVDFGDDVIAPGAFAKSIAQKMPAMLWQHDHTQVPGMWTHAEETKEGLALKGVFANTPLGSEAYELTKMGAVTGLSVGFVIPEGGSEVQKDGTRAIKEIDLWEVSPVTFPMNDLARVSAVKSKLAQGNQLTVREFELFLRDAGYSHSAAKRIAHEGYKGMSDVRDELSALSELTDRIEALNNE